MPKLNKNFTFFFAVFSFLAFSSFLASQKFLSLVINKTVYYCQSFISSLSVQIPHQLGIGLAFLLLLLFAIAVTRLLLVFIQVRGLRKSLILQKGQGEKLSGLLRSLSLEGKVYLIKDNKPLAFCFGIRNPKIYLSSEMLRLLNSIELEAVLRHEKYHLENKDTLTMLLASVGQSLFPFFPLLGDFLHNYRIEREIKADKEAITGLGDRKPLIATLSKLLSFEQPTPATVPAIADADTLEPRIKFLAGGEPTFKKFGIRNAILSFLSITALAAVILTPVYAIDVSGRGHNPVAMMCLAEQRCATWCKENNTVIPPESSEAST